jgi:ATP-dependent helicase/DNAse subunit B
MTMARSNSCKGGYYSCLTFKIETSFKSVEFHITLYPSMHATAPCKLNQANGFTAYFDFYCQDQSLTIEVKYITIKSPYPPIEPKIRLVTKEAPIPTPIQSILSNVASMLDNHEFSDFKIIVGDKEFNVHKNILSAASDSFAKIFRTRGKSYKINDIDEEVFGHLLRYIYTGKAPENLDEVAVKLFEASHCFKIDELKEKCLKKIQMKLSVANALETYNWAYNYDLEVLKMKAWELVKR